MDRARRRQASSSPFARIEDAVDAIRAGRMVIVVDDEDRGERGRPDDRRREGHARSDQLHGALRPRPDLSGDDAASGSIELEIPLMVAQNTSPLRDRVLRVDRGASGATTHRHLGRATARATVLAAIDPATRPRDLARPGHMFPLRAAHRRRAGARRPDRSGRSISRASPGCYPAGVICEIMNEDGTMARVPQLTKFAQQARPADDHDRRPDQVPDAHRVAGEARRHGEAADRVRRRSASTRSRTSVDKQTHVALVRGDIGDGSDVAGARPLAVPHRRRVAFRRAATAARSSIPAMERIAAKKAAGVLLYLQPGRARHRAGQQDPRLRAAGRRARHGRGERAARVQGRSARLRHRRRRSCATSASRSMRLLSNNPRKLGRHRGLRPVGQRVAAARDPGLGFDAPVPSRPRKRSSATSCRQRLTRSRRPVHAWKNRPAHAIRRGFLTAVPPCSPGRGAAPNDQAQLTLRWLAWIVESLRRQQHTEESLDGLGEPARRRQPTVKDGRTTGFEFMRARASADIYYAAAQRAAARGLQAHISDEVAAVFENTEWSRSRIEIGIRREVRTACTPRRRGAERHNSFCSSTLPLRARSAYRDSSARMRACV